MQIEKIFCFNDDYTVWRQYSDLLALKNEWSELSDDELRARSQSAKFDVIEKIVEPLSEVLDIVGYPTEEKVKAVQILLEQYIRDKFSGVWNRSEKHTIDTGDALNKREQAIVDIILKWLCFDSDSKLLKIEDYGCESIVIKLYGSIRRYINRPEWSICVLPLFALENEIFDQYMSEELLYPIGKSLYFILDKDEERAKSFIHQIEAYINENKGEDIVYKALILINSIDFWKENFNENMNIIGTVGDKTIKCQTVREDMKIYWILKLFRSVLKELQIEKSNTSEKVLTMYKN